MANSAIVRTTLFSHKRAIKTFSNRCTNHWNHPLSKIIKKKPGASVPGLEMRPLQNAPFCLIPASGSNFNPQNTQCIRACPVKCEAYFSGVVKIFAFLVIKQN
jgi:hypothetical protein